MCRECILRSFVLAVLGLKRTTSYHLQTNGLAEHLNQVLSSMLTFPRSRQWECCSALCCLPLQLFYSRTPGALLCFISFTVVNLRFVLDSLLPFPPETTVKVVTFISDAFLAPKDPLARPFTHAGFPRTSVRTISTFLRLTHPAPWSSSGPQGFRNFGETSFPVHLLYRPIPYPSLSP